MAGGRRAAAPRQDALGQRDPRSPASPGPSPPAALATDPDHHPRRQPLRPPGGHGVVRREWHRLIFGLPGNAVLDRLVDETADDIRTRRALDQKPCLRGFAETSYQAKSWNTDRRACARIEATTKGLDIRFVITSIETGSAEHVYETLYCARGQAENLIKLHKAQLASDRTSCRSPLANQMRLILHTAAYWLTLTVRDAISKGTCSRHGRVQHH